MPHGRRKSSLREPRVFTIFPDNRGANRRAWLEVPSQRSFTGPYCIPTSLADRKCSSFGVQGLLDELNNIMGTTFALSPPLQFHLETCISRDYDFGLAYGYLRPHWHSDFATLTKRMRWAQSRDETLRREALHPSKKYIIDPWLPPRRVWDLYSHRVIPFYWWGGHHHQLFPISHAWVAENQRSNVSTPINGREWPFPLPNHSSLDAVRIELLNTEARREYSWLDVLCLRQIGEERYEAQRLEEWKTDVPTIGNIYNRARHSSTALVYFNGLGRAFRNGNYEDPRHWFSRAWTVQEAVAYPALGGATSSSPTLHQRLPGSALQRFYDHLYKAFPKRNPISTDTLDPHPVLSQSITIMRNRHATSELDRISGLISLTEPEHLPIYDVNQSSEEAWVVFINAIDTRSRAHLFFWYPTAGNAGFSWVPSWSQVMAHEVPPASSTIEGRENIEYDETRDIFYGRTLNVLHNCSVFGLDSNSIDDPSQRSVVRIGRIVTENQWWQPHAVVARHHVIIDSTARYTLLLSYLDTRFVVGVRKENGWIQKLCILDFRRKPSWFEFDAALREDVVLI